MLGPLRSVVAVTLAISALFNGAMVTTGQSLVTEQVPVADLVLIIDQSGSLGAKNYRDELEFAKKLSGAFSVSENLTRVALVQFSTGQNTAVRLDWRQGTSAENVQRALEEMTQSQLGVGTDFSSAFSMVMSTLQTPEAGDRPEAPNVAVLITDGYMNSAWERQLAVDNAHKLRATGTILYAIHVKLDKTSQQSPVDDLTMVTGNRSRVFAVDDFQSLTANLLPSISAQIVREYQDCVFEYLPIGVCYKSSANGQCIQDATLVVSRQPQLPHGRPCPADNRTTLTCQPGGCQEACEKWAWGPWTACVPENNDCTHGVKSHQRLGQPADPKLTDTCLLTETIACSDSELVSMDCSAASAAGLNDTSGGSKLPVWAIIVIVLICLLVLTAVIIGVVIARSPKWRAKFIPAKTRANQLPGNLESAEAKPNTFDTLDRFEK